LVIATRASLVDRLDAGEAKLRQAARLTLALAARRLHGVEMDPARLHRMVGRRMQRTDELDYRLRDLGRMALERRKRKLDGVVARLGFLDVRLRISGARRRLDGADSLLGQRMKLALNRARGILAPLDAHLSQLSPLKILERGYAIVEREGKLVKSPADAPVGSEVRLRLAQGELAAKVSRPKK